MNVAQIANRAVIKPKNAAKVSKNLALKTIGSGTVATASTGASAVLVPGAFVAPGISTLGAGALATVIATPVVAVASGAAFVGGLIKLVSKKAAEPFAKMHKKLGNETLNKLAKIDLGSLSEFNLNKLAKGKIPTDLKAAKEFVDVIAERKAKSRLSMNLNDLKKVDIFSK